MEAKQKIDFPVPEFTEAFKYAVLWRTQVSKQPAFMFHIVSLTTKKMLRPYLQNFTSNALNDFKCDKLAFYLFYCTVASIEIN